jgi:hypothetical protein
MQISFDYAASDRVLSLLADGQEQHTTAVCLRSECSLAQLQDMGDGGLIRFSDHVRKGRTISITQRGRRLSALYLREVP